MTTSRFCLPIALFCLALFAASCQKEALTEPTLPAKFQRIEHQSDVLLTGTHIKPNKTKSNDTGVMDDPYTEELPNHNGDIRPKLNDTGVSDDPYSEELPGSGEDIRPKL